MRRAVARKELKARRIARRAEPRDATIRAVPVDLVVLRRPNSRPSFCSRCVVPQGLSRGAVKTSSEYTTSIVRFWNFTASQPASTASSISRLAISRSPL